MSQNCGLSGETIASYLASQLTRTTSFDRTFKTALRLDGTPLADRFFKTMIQELSTYALKNNNQLPGSFTEKKLSDLYLRLKLSGVEMSPAFSELLLLSLHKKGMHKEIISFCTD